MRLRNLRLTLNKDVCFPNSNGAQHSVRPRHCVSLMVPLPFPAPELLPWTEGMRRNGEEGERGEREAGPGRHLLRSSAHLRVMPAQLCPNYRSRRNQVPVLSTCLPLSYPGYF